MYPQINNNNIYDNSKKNNKIFYQAISTKIHVKSFKYLLIKLSVFISFIIFNKKNLYFKSLSNERINYININNSTLNKTSNHTTSVCLCTLAKLENLYIREFVFHYKNMELIKYIYMIIMI